MMKFHFDKVIRLIVELTLEVMIVVYAVVVMKAWADQVRSFEQDS